MENQRLADFTALNDTQIYQFSPRYFPLNYFATKIRFSYLGDWGMIEIQKKHTSPWKKGWGKKRQGWEKLFGYSWGQDW